MTGEIADDRTLTRAGLHSPQLAVLPDGINALALGAPERRALAVARVKAGHFAGGNRVRNLLGDADDVQLAFRQLPARDVSDTAAVRCPVHVNAICRTKSLGDNTPIAGCKLIDDKVVNRLLCVGLPTSAVCVRDALLVRSEGVPRRARACYASDYPSCTQVQ